MSRQSGKQPLEALTGHPFWLRFALSPTARATTTTVHVTGAAPPERLRFNDGPPEEALKGRVEAFSNALSELSGRPWSPAKAPPPSNHELRRFREISESLFSEIFKHSDRDTHRRNREQLETCLDHPNLERIYFDCDIPGIPFDAMYYGDPEEGDGLSRFVGTRAPIVHAPRMETDSVYGAGSEAIGLLGTRQVTSVAHRGDDSVFAMFKRFKDKCAVEEDTPLRGPNRETMPDANLEALFRTLAQRRSVWHVASHMQMHGSVPAFELDNNLIVRAEHFDSRKPKVRQLIGQPLVFLNLCSSSGTGMVGDPSFADNLLLLKAGGVIGTHSLVNDRFATHFAGRFYEHALSGPSIAESLHRSRLESLAQDQSWASLTYSFHSMDDFTLQPDFDEGFDFEGLEVANAVRA